MDGGKGRQETVSGLKGMGGETGGEEQTGKYEIGKGNGKES